MYQKLVEVIHSHRSWVAVHRSDGERMLMIQVGRELRPIHCRVLTLVATRSNGLYKRGHVWDIPEYNLDKAVRSLKRNEHFKERWSREDISMEDAEAIINHASYGFIHLLLSDL